MIERYINEASINNLIAQGPKKKLGEILVEQKVITPEELAGVLEIQEKDGGRLGDIMVKQGLVKMDDLLVVLSSQYNVPVADIKKQQIQIEAISLIPEEVARKNYIVPLELFEENLIIAMAYPDDVRTIRDITTMTGKRVQIVLASPTEINTAIDLYYRAGKAIELSLGQITSRAETKAESVAEISAQTPIAQSLDLIIQQAVRDRASDVHVEPQENRVRIRYRIDGILHDMYSLPLTTHGPLMSRIKILAEMNIAEQRRSQDGQFSTKVGIKQIDIRAATMATAYGERAALRILDRTLTPLGLEEIGFLPEQMEKYRKILRSSYGVVLVGGPTGSGKTTTLYASLSQFNPNTQNIITIEDPIEYRFSDINQTQINNKAGITFASGLRTILRHDPDVVLVGEVRDKETASIVTQTALTGRLVLATIHANDAISIVFRLVDLGIEPYLISPTLIAALAQRMVRRICNYCKVKADVTAEEAAAYLKELGEKPGRMYRGSGCNMCANTGYRGRVALFELLVMTENLRRLVLSGASGDEIKDVALREGMLTVQRDGMQKAREGTTTVSEVLRSTFTA
jgi:general secretion pathway protein E